MLITVLQKVTVTGQHYFNKLQNFVLPSLRNHDIDSTIFKDVALPHNYVESSQAIINN